MPEAISGFIICNGIKGAFMHDINLIGCCARYRFPGKLPLNFIHNQVAAIIQYLILLWKKEYNLVGVGIGVVGATPGDYDESDIKKN